MIEGMRLLIFLVLFVLTATSVHAQTVADIARQERARQSRVRSTRVFTAEGARSTAPAAEAGKADTAKAGDKPATSAPIAAKEADKAQATPGPASASATPPKPPAEDPAKQWAEQMDKMRARIQELQDQESALQLQINRINNDIYAPVTDQATKDQAMARLAEAQQKLASVRLELEQRKKTLDLMNLQGPPKK